MKKPYTNYSERSNLTHKFYDMNKVPLNIGDHVEIKRHERDGFYHKPVTGELKKISVHGVLIELPNGENQWIAYSWNGSLISDRVYEMVGKEEPSGRNNWVQRGYIKLLK